ncbi:MAG: NAD(P)H-dependent oxidoreductase subunit E [Armatimonadota bacterium]|nr:NAD(P)H-dependent oxidoreductase subunit E [Armatimonadota bacterium]MDR7486486.1 NAD(P)H-dependent oxidoreductase subunit E [Armatimonadota bacterium]MDR7537173.1 NAD(P)H-dependent oxidoreductase subunit E [Armatimonadota bacterium]
MTDTLPLDPRYRELDAAIRRHHRRPDGLIEVLHIAQRLWGHLPREVLAYVARGLTVPPSLAYGVATFYHFFTLVPRGRHTVIVCTGTACYLKGGGRIVEALQRATGVRAGTVAPDGTLGVEAVRCLGPCSQAPVVVFDGEVTGELPVEAVVQRVQAWTAAAPHQARAGAP